jgi:ATP-dependent DNA helicase RecG
MIEPAPPEAKITLSTPVAALKGIGPKRAEALLERGIATVAEVVFHLPSRYQDWRTRTALEDLRPGTIAIVEGELGRINERPMRGRGWRRLASGQITVGARKLRVVWFNLPSYMRGYIPGGQRVLLRGRLTATEDGGLEMAHPDLIALDEGTPRPVRPVYRLPAQISQRLFASIVLQLMPVVSKNLPGALPPELRGEVMTVGEAIAYLHDPPDDAEPAVLLGEDSPAHRALALDELFAFETALALEHQRSRRRAGAAFNGNPTHTRKFLASLPFKPTKSQFTAIAQIAADLPKPTQMNRMLLGDVGSGKTVVAFWAALRAVESGYQAAMMAPTELLAEQHFHTFDRMGAGLGIRSALLTGRVTGVERNNTLRDLASGRIDIVFGTQALVQQHVKIAKLGLGVIDEQHRFGVFDRARLKELGPTANVLLMTATPIPRSLAMTLFANLDVSFLDEMPPGRTPIETELYRESQIANVHHALRDEIESGGRAYYVVPLIEGDDDEAKSVAHTSTRLGRVLGPARIGTMHGRMRAAEKDRVMRAFRDGVLDVLVSTTVVEVGIDVPEATVIVIDAAERYGLAQLHQLRGRVGRGTAPSRCILVASNEADEAALKRLDVMRRATSGREVAEADLRLRGPGDLLGARQTGALPLRFIHMVRDYRMIEQARAMAEEWLARDPRLESPASAGVRAAVRKMLTLGFSLGDVG